MEGLDLLHNFREISVETPVDMIIKQIRELITSGQLKPGDKLPPERKLVERLGVGRTHVRDAIKKLEFYGILRTMPQSGTIVAGLGITALEGLITDVLKIEDNDFGALVETRVILETQAAALAADRRTEEDIQNIEQAFATHQQQVLSGESGVEEDLIFHLKIAEASKNPVLRSLMLIITPDIIASFNKLDICKDGRELRALDEHRAILDHIIHQRPDAAARAMRNHLQDVIDFSKQMS
ncbi:FadR/GntR family transcriptional regulator [Pontibacter sp. G13]|uniref:FadR/GntR family transcriptional regulator n=1 Tax=Pontibacter sp. G13 TaxID=3074898 RepID=UPI0028896FD3|nr:FadR/GntR family transcriptional regulator [Pontibacter sp. G13]WNJ18679.1 FadR/GntR family transcriptional regulator [Pontibacter sp. G13]